MISSLPPVAKAAECVRSGALDARDLVEFCLEQIDRLENRIQAWVVVDRDGALRQAQELMLRVGRGETAGILAGVPVGIKDIIDVEGFPTKAGSCLRANHVATDDAAVVTRLRDADAVILGKTVTTEFACFDPAPTRNPWNLQHTPGGSSSGSAAATALQMCCAAIGTQTGGSIVRPASYCGVAGLKPTFDAISLRGVIPVSARLDHAGPFARFVDDLAWLFLAIAEPVAVSKSLAELRHQAPWARASEGSIDTVADVWRRVPIERPESNEMAVLEKDFIAEASPDVQAVTRTALDLLGLASCPRATMPDSYEEVRSHHRRIMAHDTAAIHKNAYSVKTDAFGPNIAGLIEEGLAVSERQYQDALLHQQQFFHEAKHLFTGGRLAILPATNTAAPDNLDTTGDPRFNSLWSYAGFPAVTIPCGLTTQGLPCGLQLIGPLHSELRLLAAAAWCEERLEFGKGLG